MNCPTCHTPITKLSCALTGDERHIATSFMCFTCGKRTTRLELNPRYQAPLMAEEPKRKKYTWKGKQCHTAETL